MGSACRPNPKWEAAANKLEIQKAKTRRGQLRPPAQVVPSQIQRQPLQLRLLAEARGQVPGPVIACQRKGGEDFFFYAPRTPERAAEAGAEEAAVAVEPEEEPSKFRELWQGPAERREEFLERLASVEEPAPGGPGASRNPSPACPGPPGSPGSLSPGLLRSSASFRASSSSLSLLSCGRRCPKSSDLAHGGRGPQPRALAQEHPPPNPCLDAGKRAIGYAEPKAGVGWVVEAQIQKRYGPRATTLMQLSIPPGAPKR